MDLFLSKEDREIIKGLNNALGMRHRTEPYDFNKLEDLVKAITYITAEYVDFYYYWAILDDIDEKFDESVETFYPAEWQKLYLPETKGKKNINNAMQKLDKAKESFWKLMEDAKKQCKNIWSIIFTNASDEVLHVLFGKVFRPAPEYIEKLLEMDFMNMGIWQYSVEESAKVFMAAMMNHHEKNILPLEGRI